MSTARSDLGPARATALPAEERRSSIVAAALPLLLEHGEAVTTRQIADAAGIAEGTIFRVFPDKDSVIQAVIDVVFDRSSLEEALSAIELDRPLEDVLEQGVGLLQERVVSIFRVVSAVGPRFADSTRRGLVVSPWLVGVLGQHRSALRTKPADAARLLQSITVATTHPNLVDKPLTPGQVVQLFLHGVAAPS